MQLQYEHRISGTVQLEHSQRRAAVETKVEEAAKRGKPEVRNTDKTRGETLFLSDNETKRTMKFTW